MNATEEYLDSNTTKGFGEYQIRPSYYEKIIFSVVFLICCIGVPLNGIVIWFLGFQIKRNPFTILILNLAIADFGFLISMTLNCIRHFIHGTKPGIFWKILSPFFIITYINGLFLLTAISIDRCVAVLFPIWHHCSRPKYLSSAVCVSLWIFSFLLGINNIISCLFSYNATWDLHLIVTAVLCLPLITISTVILIIKICLKAEQIKRRRLLMMILITLLCFLILSLPLYIYVFITLFPNKNDLFDVNGLVCYLDLGASLNSSINPVIYFLVGKKKRARTRESIKVIFQRVFREEEAPEI
ncbi:mas-related G-protein coupled receptor member H-like [Ahaetulla prasina]|uniref:mas-related G-protein coupled receptor member H-like n=1 Tax=Ahaetulla prasina TaxID=499056 RepID=UPI00264A157F|nr:mas-related G-protein coupled receptor member H-like [Ahaetulla prasina]XP_058033858.1 mas-related G-protein coupled receptor member H-like [Ahaetulla prasina]